MVIRVQYKNGVFKPLEDVKLAEGTMADVYVPARPTGHPALDAVDGMWADRTDITSGVEYVNALRSQPRASRHGVSR